MADVASMVAVGAAALGAGCVNAIAGGGSLITFPVLVAVGLPPVAASATNTVALCPGYLGATLAQRGQLAGQRGRMLRLLPASAVCGVAGALLLLQSGNAAFAAIVPFLILLAVVMLAMQPRISKAIGVRETVEGAPEASWVIVPVGLAAVYGGYFGAGMGVMILAALAIALADTLVRLNALKQAVSLTVNVAAAAVFVATDRVDWPFTAVMLGCALAGGAVGGKIASRVPSEVLRWLIVTLGVAISGFYFYRLVA